MTKAELESKHLSELHELAAGAGVRRYRLLSREALVEELLVRGAEQKPKPRPRPSRRRAAAKAPPEPEVEQAGLAEAADQAEKEPEAGESRDRELAESAEPTTGVLDVLPAGHGFLRGEDLEARSGDVYVSASQIRRCELRAGDEVSGPARAARRGERHPALIQVETVNGREPAAAEAPSFEQLTPVAPARRLPLELGPDDLLARAADLLAPLAFGQRVLVLAAPRSGRTTLLRSIARGIGAGAGEAEVIVLLVDERPEEVTEWRRRAPEAGIVAAPADLGARDQARLAQLAVARAKRRAEAGADVILLVDSLTRLGLAYRDPSGVKPVFGAGRELEQEGAGSLTVIGTALAETPDGEGALQAVATTESATIALDPELAAAGVTPAIDVARTGVVGEERLRAPAELEAARRLRSELRALEPEAAAELLAERLRASTTNAELLASL